MDPGLEDPDAFAELYDGHVGQILSWSSVRVGDYGADLTAEVFAAAWSGRKRFRDEHDGTALPWLYGIANNVFRSSLRKRRVEYGARERLGLPITVVHADFEAVDDRLSFPSAVLREVANLPESSANCSSCAWSRSGPIRRSPSASNALPSQLACASL